MFLFIPILVIARKKDIVSIILRSSSWVSIIVSFLNPTVYIMSLESKYVSYLKSITQKIKSNKEKYTDRCYKTAMTMLLYFEREYHKHIQKYIINNSTGLDYFINNILSPNQNILLDVEISCKF